MSDDTGITEPPTSQADSREFHVVGIGASAGGLEPLEEFFEAMPDDAGMAFVVVQHLSPDFESHMSELLSRKTRMAIHSVTDGMRVEPDSVYLIPPKMEMVVKDRRLFLTAKGPDRSLSHPIDLFFRSLAHEFGERSVGIVLSGTGSDGSRGIVDIHGEGGLVMGQDAPSARFDGMPLSAQATGVVDVILPPQELAAALLRYTKDGVTASAMGAEQLALGTKDGVKRVFQLLHQLHGIDFSHYKSTTVGRRIQRRIDILGLRGLDDYIDRLNEDPVEVNDLYKDLLIGVTKFFRDPEAFSILEKEVVPKLFDGRPQNEPIRVWVAGCASGEEAYSIAIVIAEMMTKCKSHLKIQIFATDIDEKAIEYARKGKYPKSIESNVSKKRLIQYFIEEDG